MHVIFSQFSGLVGLFVFLSQLWRYAPLEKAVFTAVVSALAVYLFLLVADVVIRRIVSYRSPARVGSRSGAATKPARSASRTQRPPARKIESFESESVAVA